MINLRPRFLFAILCILLLCTSAQATTTLQITVRDSFDNFTIPHATIFVNGANYARTNALGEAFLTHQGTADQDIRVTMNGYDDWSQSVRNNTTVLLVNLTRKTLTFKVNLFDSDSLGPVIGATVNLTAENTTQSRQTDSTGMAAFPVMAATTYSIDITAPNYQARTDTVEMGTENQEVQYKLLSGNSFSFVIKDKDTGKALSGAEVRLNSVLAGKTDDRGILITPVIRGKYYTIEIRKDGYQSSTESRTISESDAVFYATLTKAAIGAYVYVVDESHKPITGSDVYVNGTLSGTTNDYGRMSLPSLVSGDYLLEVRKAGYVTQSRPITISGQSQDYTFTLPYESSALTIFVQDKDKKVVSNASILIDGNPAGVTDNNGQLLTHVSFNTGINITVSKEGYVPHSVTKEIRQGNGTATETIIIEKSLDWGLITMIIAGIIGILILFAIIRMLGRKSRRHVTRRNEI